MYYKPVYEALYECSLCEALRRQPVTYPELAHDMYVFARWACGRQCVRVDKKAPAAELLRKARAKAADKAAFRAEHRGRDAKRAWQVAYATEYKAQSNRLKDFLKFGKWD